MILLSLVNVKLWDEYPSLRQLCAALDAGKSELTRVLTGLDDHYDPVHNQFV